MSDAPRLERIDLSQEGATAVLTIHSDKVNALDRATLDELAAAVAWCEADNGVRALVLTGHGEIFSAGLNVNEVLSEGKGHADVILEALQTALARLFACPLPTVAAVNGSAIAGGALLACACDRRLIAEEARIGVTELQVGVAFPVGAVDLLRHVCGHRAEELILGAQLLKADQAVSIGLAHASAPRAELFAAAFAAAERLAAMDPRAYALAKVATRQDALRSIEDEPARSLEQQVREHWKDDRTRESLERLLQPKR